MITLAEIIRSFRGIWRIVRGDFRGIEDFDVSPAGFWRSFQAVILTIPVDLVFSAIFAKKGQAENQRAAETLPIVDLLVEQVWSVGGWIVFLFLLLHAARRLDITDRYGAYVVVQNWGGLFVMLPLTVLGGIYLLDFLHVAVVVFLALSAIVVLIRYYYLLTRASLGKTAFFCIGIMATEFIVVGSVDGLRLLLTM